MKWTKDFIREYYKTYRKNHIQDRKDDYKFKKEAWRNLLTLFGYDHCVKCGYNKSFAALDFHHRDPTIKVNNILVGFLCRTFNSKNIDTVLGEISKCNVLCSNCHRELHETEEAIRHNKDKDYLFRGGSDGKVL